MDALPPLSAASRYGNVRQTDAAMLARVAAGLVARICAGLGPACASLNDDAAAATLKRVNAVHAALATLDDEALRTPWIETLRRLAVNETAHGLLTGRCARLLLDEDFFSTDELSTRLARELSRANAPAMAAAWLEGFLGGSGTVLLHRPTIWALLDGWLDTLSPEHFTVVLPLLRRTFSTFAAPERRQMGERVRQEKSTGPQVGPALEEDIDETRANLILPTLAALLGE